MATSLKAEKAKKNGTGNSYLGVESLERMDDENKTLKPHPCHAVNRGYLRFVACMVLSSYGKVPIRCQYDVLNLNTMKLKYLSGTHFDSTQVTMEMNPDQKIDQHLSSIVQH
jgi:hypothetical protein